MAKAFFPSRRPGSKITVEFGPYKGVTAASNNAAWIQTYHTPCFLKVGELLKKVKEDPANLPTLKNFFINNIGDLQEACIRNYLIHPAVDIDVNKNESVHAIIDGEVAEVKMGDACNGFNQSRVLLNHEFNCKDGSKESFQSAYYHLEANDPAVANLKVGQKVKAGDILACGTFVYNGTKRTGGSRNCGSAYSAKGLPGDHLHFEIRKAKGTPLDAWPDNDQKIDLFRYITTYVFNTSIYKNDMGQIDSYFTSQNAKTTSKQRIDFSLMKKMAEYKKILAGNPPSMEDKIGLGDVSTTKIGTFNINSAFYRNAKWVFEALYNSAIAVAVSKKNKKLRDALITKISGNNSLESLPATTRDHVLVRQLDNNYPNWTDPVDFYSKTFGQVFSKSPAPPADTSGICGPTTSASSPAITLVPVTPNVIPNNPGSYATFSVNALDLEPGTPITVAASNVPNGMTVDVLLSDDQTTATASVTVNEDFPAGNYTVDLEASTPTFVVSKKAQFYVTSEASANYTFLPVEEVVLRQQEIKTARLKIARTNFTDPIYLTVESSSELLKVSTLYTEIFSSEALIIIEADPNTPPGNYQITAYTDALSIDLSRNVLIPVTVLPAANVEIEVTPKSEIVGIAGSSKTVTLDIGRSNTSSPIKLDILGAPAGLSIVPTESTVSGNSTVLTVQASNEVAPGKYVVEVQADTTDASVAKKSTYLTLDVTGGPSTFDFSVVSSEILNQILVLNKGSKTSTKVNINRNSLTEKTLLSINSPPEIKASIVQETKVDNSVGINIEVSKTMEIGNYFIEIIAKDDKNNIVKSSLLNIDVVDVPQINYSSTSIDATEKIYAPKNSTTELEVNVTRENLVGTLAIVPKAVPPGLSITVDKNPTPTNINTYKLQIDPNALNKDYLINFEITGVDKNGVSQKIEKPVQISVVNTPKLSFPGETNEVVAVPVTVGGESNAGIALSRTNFTSDLQVTAIAPHSGITVNLDSNSMAKNSNYFTVSASETVPPGEYPVTLNVFSTSEQKAATVKVIVEEKSQVSAQPVSPVQISAGISTQIKIPLQSTNFIGKKATLSVFSNPSNLNIQIPQTIVFSNPQEDISAQLFFEKLEDLVNLPTQGNPYVDMLVSPQNLQNFTVRVYYTPSQTPNFELSVLPKQKITAYKGEEVEISFVANKSSITQNVVFSIATSGANSLPEGVTGSIDTKIQTTAKTQANVKLKIGNSVPAGVYTVRYTGTVQALPLTKNSTFQLEVLERPGFQAKLKNVTDASVMIAQGKMVDILVNLKRTKLDGPIEFKFEDVPANVTAETRSYSAKPNQDKKYSIPSTSENEFYIRLNPGKTAKLGTYKIKLLMKHKVQKTITDELIIEVKIVKVLNITLDPGHGKDNLGANTYDPGASSAGYTEADIVLNFGLKGKEILEKEGFSVHLTRSSKDDSAPLCPIGGSGRLDNAQNANSAVYISLHCNGSDSSDANGSEVAYKAGKIIGKRDTGRRNLRGEKIYEDIIQYATIHPQNYALSQIILSVLLEKFGLNDRREVPFSINRDYIICVFGNYNDFSGPRSLIEFGFISNKTDRDAMLNEENIINFWTALAPKLRTFIEGLED